MSMLDQPEDSNIIEEALNGIDRIMVMMKFYQGTATFDSPQEDREMSLGAGFAWALLAKERANLAAFYEATKGN